MGYLYRQQNLSYPMLPWKMLGWLLSIQVLVAFVGRSLAPLGLVIGEDLELTKAQIGLLPAALFFGQSIISIPIGFLTDKIGTKQMMLVIALCLGGSFILMTFVSLFGLLLVMIALGGIGYGASHPATNRGVILWFSQRNRGIAMGIKQMGVTVGSAFAVLLLLPLATIYSWQIAILFASLLLIIIGFFAFLFYQESLNHPKKTPLKKSNHFLLELIHMVKHKALVLISISSFFLNGSQMILNTYIILYSYEKLGISLFLSGTLLVISEIGGSMGRLCWGIISDVFFDSRRIIILIIISILTASISTYIALLPKDTSFLKMIPIILVFGFCISGFNAIWMNATTEVVAKEQSGIATGFSITLGSGGVIVGPPLFGLIVDMTGSYTVGWLFVSFIMVITAILLIIAKFIVGQELNMMSDSE